MTVNEYRESLIEERDRIIPDLLSLTCTPEEVKVAEGYFQGIDFAIKLMDVLVKENL